MAVYSFSMSSGFISEAQTLSVTLLWHYCTNRVTDKLCAHPLVYSIFNLDSKATCLKDSCRDYKNKISASLKVIWKTRLYYLKTELLKKSVIIYVSRHFKPLRVVDVTWCVHSNMPEWGCLEFVNLRSKLNLGRDILRISISKAVPSFCVLSKFPPICERPVLCGWIS